MSDTARIHTKLTADGSELTRALNQGIAKGSDFKTQMTSIGKAIGGAFTGAAVIASMRAIVNGQIEAMKGFQGLSKNADAFATSLENLDEKLRVAGLGEGKGGIGRVMRDYQQMIRSLSTDIKNLEELENVGGIAGAFKAIGDAFEVASSGKLQTVDEAAIQQMGEQLEDLGRAYEKAEAKAKVLLREHNKALRENLKQFDFTRKMESGVAEGDPEMLATYKEYADTIAEALREAFKAEPNAGILSQLKEAVNLSDKLAESMAKMSADQAAAAFDWQIRMAQMDQEARTPGDVSSNPFVASLERIGGGNFGAVANQKKADDQTAKVVAAIKEELPILKGILEAAKKFSSGVF